MSDSPSVLLERAAALIEQRAAAIPSFGGMHGVDGDEAWTEWLNMFIDDPAAVAQPLVEWLRGAAFEFAEAAGPAEAAEEPVESYVGSASRAALAFARQVLGERLDHDWFFPYDSHPGARECSRCGAHDDSQPCP